MPVGWSLVSDHVAPMVGGYAGTAGPKYRKVARRSVVRTAFGNGVSEHSRVTSGNSYGSGIKGGALCVASRPLRNASDGYPIRYAVVAAGKPTISCRSQRTAASVGWRVIERSAWHVTETLRLHYADG